MADDLDLNPEPRLLAKRARLRYVTDGGPGFTRRRRGRGFSFHDANGRPLRDDAHVGRIRSLVIPPAWSDVWICPFPDGHIQATGRDDKGRKQYRYHDRWTQTANWVKFGQLRAFGRDLPATRAQIRRDLRSDDDRLRTLALMAALLDKTALRVGNREYAEENESYGLTTLLDDHATVRGDLIRFEFVGKSGQEQVVELKDKMLAKHVKRLLGRTGRRLFEAKAADGSLAPVEAEHLNEYLRPITPPGCTAKTFRTWHGTVAAFQVLAAACECQEAAVGAAARQVVVNGTNGRGGLTKKVIEATLREAIQAAAGLLGNTTAVCKAYYIHPALCDLYAESSLAGYLAKLRPKRLAGLSQPERRLLALLEHIERRR